MTPSTLSFVLRWQAATFWAGVFISAFAGYLLCNFQPDPPNIASLGVESGVSLFGPFVYAIGLLVGLGLVVLAWTRAARLRIGS